jgi:hypothetical protein
VLGVVIGVGVAAWSVLWLRYGGGGPGVEQDAIRAASALMAGAGSAAVLRACTTASPGSRALLRWALAARLSAGSTVGDSDACSLVGQGKE